MSDSILSAVMRIAKEITRAERGMSVDAELTVVDVADLTAEIIEDDSFQKVALKSLSQAMETNESVLTNNIITDPAKAPVTNTSFTDLRVIVTIPVEGAGAIYLDQHIRNGMFQRDTIDKLSRMVTEAIAQDTPVDLDDLRKIYDSLD